MALLSTLLEILNSTPAGALITSVVVTDSGYNNLDDTAIATSNSFIKIIGSGFSSNSNVFIGNIQVPAANVTYTSSTELRVALPNITLGTDSTVSIFNSTGSGGIYASRVLSSGFPTVTVSSYVSGNRIVNTQLLATGDGTLTYSLKSGSSLPSGLSLAANGLIFGTVTTDSTTSFTVLVDDSQNQTTQRDITLTIASTDTYFKTTTLLLQADNVSNNVTNGSFVDSSNNNLIITSSGLPAQGSINPFGVGNWSNYFTRTNVDYFSIADNANLELGNGDFTIEAWVYMPTLPTSGQIHTILGKWNATTQYSYLFCIENATTLGFYYTTSGSAVNSLSVDITSVFSAGAWNHVCAVRSGNSLYFFVNGTQAGSTQSIGTITLYNSSAITTIGSAGTDGHVFNGYISNLRMIKGTALYTSSFTPSTTPLTAIANTQLLTCQSNRFKDESTNNFTITPTGSPTIERFNPFDVNANSYTTSVNTFVGSTNFSGTGQYLDFNGANLALGTGDFTIEMWVYANSYGQGGADSRLAGSQNNGNAGWQMAIRNSGTINFGSWSTATDSTSLAPVQTWNHIAWTRESGVEKLYINGVLSNTVTRSLNMTTTATSIGRVYSTTNLWNGYVSNFRIVKGTAVYTANFTPSTTPLTAIANTVFLTCQNSQIVVDESTNKYSITKTGTPQQTLKNPFTLTDTSTANAIYGGSYYFNGSSDYLIPTYTSSFDFASVTTFTLEAWVYITAGTGSSVFSTYNAVANRGWAFIVGTTSIIYGATWNGASNYATFNTTIPVGTWNHVAVVRNGSGSNNLTVYVNGVSVGSQTFSGSWTENTGAAIGYSNSSSYPSYWTGYISNFRMVSGRALYTANFTPSTTPLTAVANTVLLLSGTNAGVYDATLENNIQFSGDVRVRTDVTKYGTGSIYFDGTTDYAIAPSTTNFGYGTGDFTIEFWMYSVNPAANQTVFSHLTSVNGVQPYIYTNINTIRYYTSGGDRISGGTLTANTWYHVALCRSSGSTKLFLNGTQAGSTYTDANNYGTSAPLVLATYYNSGIVTSNMFNGYLDDIRITKGYARYTANFTPPDTTFNNKSR